MEKATVSLKDFYVGQTVYECVNDRNITVRERVIASVGRKYVTLEGSWNEKYYEHEHFEGFLVEKKDWGRPNYLFLSRDAYELYIEEKELDQYISSNIGNKLHKMTIDQKRQIKDWMEE